MTIQEDAMADIGEEDVEINTYSPDAEDEDGSSNQ